MNLIKILSGWIVALLFFGLFLVTNHYKEYYRKELLATNLGSEILTMSGNQVQGAYVIIIWTKVEDK